MIKKLIPYVKSGFHIPFIGVGLYFLFNYLELPDPRETGPDNRRVGINIYLSVICCLKLFPANYYYWFERYYNYLPSPLNQLKQFVRFTDTGHIASFLYYFYPEYIGVFYNVHFVITFGYWFCMIFLGGIDRDEIETKDEIKWFTKIWVSLNHGLVYTYLLYNVYLSPDSGKEMFSYMILLYSYVWLWMWGICIYLPWKYFTGDCVYEFLDINKYTKVQRLFFVGLIHVLIIISQISGYLIEKYS